jgi:hypothetical protein
MVWMPEAAADAPASFVKANRKWHSLLLSRKVPQSYTAAYNTAAE